MVWIPSNTLIYNFEEKRAELSKLPKIGIVISVLTFFSKILLEGKFYHIKTRQLYLLKD